MTLSGHTEGVSSCRFISPTEVCTGSWDHTIRIWDLEQGRETACVVSVILCLCVLYQT